jgi:hypothetical protein
MADAKTTKAVRAFLREVNDEIVTGRASERSYYPAIERLVEAFAPNVNAQIEQTGDPSKPDFGVERRKNRIGFIEVKEPHVSLVEIERDAAAGKTDDNAEQLNRYLREHDNLLYTNLLEWRRFRHHAREPVQTAAIATLGGDGKLHLRREGLGDFERLIGTYLAAKPEPQTTAKGLALEIARLTKVLDVNTQKALGEGADYLKSLFDVFQKELIHGLKADEFADMYAQTVAYGLFTACILEGGGRGFNRHGAGRALPKTNPFLRRVFKSLVDDDNMPPSVTWVVEELAELVGAANIASVGAELAGFGRKSLLGRGRHGGLPAKPKMEDLFDPIIYFYEHFLRGYDPAKAKKRGVYYTPLPVVGYIVRSIDELLKEEFDKPLGLADPGVIILDPACGTGTFLYYVIIVIRERIRGKRGQAYWNNEYVPRLLKRLFGFELLMAPYTIAHLKLAELLRETGYEFKGDQRLGIYLTNTLEEAEGLTEGQLKLGIMEAISKEKEGADKVKEEEPVMVVLGNPPYAGHSANLSWVSRVKKRERTFIGNLLNDYYYVDGQPLGERNPKWLQDDYVKFLRWAQWRIDRTGKGVVAMITNHGYLDNPTFRGMRQNLMASFDAVYLLDLHGNAKKKERAPDGGPDENVFDIMQGVSIALFGKGTKNQAIEHADLYGTRWRKYDKLASTDLTQIEWTPLEPQTPYYLFKPRDRRAEAEYEKGFNLHDIFPVNGVGMTTARDKCVIEWPNNVAALVKRVEYFRDSVEPNEAVCGCLNIPVKKGWNITRARELAKGVKNPEDFIVPVLYRPFDLRRIFYHDSLVWRTVKQVMCFMLAGPNLGLITNRQVMGGPIRHTWISEVIVDLHIIQTAHASAYLFPVYRYLCPEEIPVPKTEEREYNYSREFAENFLNSVGGPTLQNSPEVGMRSGSREVLYPEDIFYYIYGVLHSPTYRTRYAEFLKIDFPRVPFPKDYESFDKLAAAGQKLAELHLLKNKDRWDWQDIGQRGDGADTTVGKVEYDEKKKEIIFAANKPAKEQVRVGPVPKHIWEFHVGGYQVLQKWLKDRKGREVSLGDYVPIIVALKETDRIMKEEIDRVFKEMLGIE